MTLYERERDHSQALADRVLRLTKTVNRFTTLAIFLAIVNVVSAIRLHQAQTELAWWKCPPSYQTPPSPTPLETP